MGFLVCLFCDLPFFFISFCLSLGLTLCFVWAYLSGYCHEGCSLNSTFSTFKEVEFLTTCKKCNDARLLIKKEHSIESTPSPLTLKAQEHSSLAISKPAKPKCYDQIPRSSKVKDCRPDMKQVASHPPVETKSRRRNTSWGIIWKKNNSEDTGFDFRLKNILLKRSSSLPGSAHPVCHLCRKSYRPDLMYIRCEMCTSKFLFSGYT